MCGEEFDSFCCRVTTMSRAWSSIVAAVSRALPELSEPCLGWTREPRRQTKSLGARRQYSQATANNVLPVLTGSPAFLTRSPPGSRPVSIALRNKVNFTNYATKLSQNYYTTSFRHFSGNEHPYSVIFKSIFHEKLLQNSSIWRGNRVLTFLGDNDRAARVLFVQHPREQGEWCTQNPSVARVLT